MTITERNATLYLALIFTFRMLGLFMVLPLFSLYANSLPDATPTLLGLAMGIYGLTQALLQLPFGMWSDKIGRKPVIALGLAIFALGSLLTAFSTSMYGIILGRALQGAGAVGSTTIALVADLTREDQRAKAMAIIGMTIGGSFSLAMVLGPLLNTWLSVPAIFLVSAGLALVAIALLYTKVPNPLPLSHNSSTDALRNKISIQAILFDPELLRLNFGIFTLHAILTANFVVIPMALKNIVGIGTAQQWYIYLPPLILAAVIAVFFINLAEKKQCTKIVFLSAIAGLVVTELLSLLLFHNLVGSLIALFLFFTSFTLLEANLPALISKLAPPNKKGAAMGVYSSSQFLGIFFGGMLGGWLLGHYDISHVFLACVGCAAVWLVIASPMQVPAHTKTSPPDNELLSTQI